jgi:hypothetical protein
MQLGAAIMCVALPDFDKQGDLGDKATLGNQ